MTELLNIPKPPPREDETGFRFSSRNLPTSVKPHNINPSLRSYILLRILSQQQVSDITLSRGYN